MNLYRTGRVLQLAGLLLMPFAIWVAHFHRHEAGSISIFMGSAIIFYLGLLLIRKER